MSDDTASGRPHPDEPEAPEAGAASPADAQAGPPRRRAAVGPWWRVAVAATALGALTWGFSGSGATLSLGGDGADPATATAGGPSPSGLVSSTVLACPGALPAPAGGSGEAAEVRVLAAAAPASVRDVRPPADPDGEATTAAPDDAASTAAADDATGTGEPDDAGSTAGPDDAGSTAGPYDAASTTSAGPTSGSRLHVLDPDGPSAALRAGAPVPVEPEGPGGVVVEAEGPTAPGVAGGQLAVATGAGARGLGLTGCVAPAETRWLLGGGSAPGQAEQLVLTNPGPDAVTVEVTVLGSDGPVATTGASGIVVPGGGQVVELLDGLAPAADAAVVSVAATGGPVVAHLVETYREGTTDRGTEIVGPLAAPATDLVVPALPAVPEGLQGRVVLRLAAPGDAPAVVDLTALTPEGGVRLADLVTRVPAGSTVEVPLDDLPTGATALRLRSDQPVTGGARLELLPAEKDPEVVAPGADDEAASTADADADGEADGEADADADADDADADDAGATGRPGQGEQGEPLLRPAGDLAWVGATAPSTAPLGLALPDRAAVPEGRAWVAVTAVDAATARVTWVDDRGAVTARSLDLPNDTTTLLEAPAEARAVWVTGTGVAGVVASAHVVGADGRGPYAASTTLPAAPWQEQVTRVLPTVP